MKDPQQASLLELCNKGIGVYSPHTSVDGAVGGVNDYLVDVVSSVDINGVHVLDTKPIIPLKAPVEGTGL
jgi:putative NIF3 family GTP cyclohydrolase 1 type 2